MKVYEVLVWLHEGGPRSLGYYTTKESAHAFAKEEQESEDWEGPNVEGFQVKTHEVKE